jgi:hypothetical protein
MTIEELRDKLNFHGVNPDFYSLEGELLPDRVVLYKNYHRWETFYYDERGNRERFKVFESEEGACDYILDYFLRKP